MNKRDRKHKLSKRRFHSRHATHQNTILIKGSSERMANWYTLTDAEIKAGHKQKNLDGQKVILFRYKKGMVSGKDYYPGDVLISHPAFHGHNGGGRTTRKPGKNMQTTCLWFFKDYVKLLKKNN